MEKKYLESVSASGLFKYLKPGDYENACAELRMAPHKYMDQETIYSQDAPVKRAGIVHNGLIRGEKLLAEGTSHLAYIYSKGDVFAFEGTVSGKKTSPLDYVSEGRSVALFFDVQKIFSSSYENALIKGLLELLANDNIKKLYRVEILSRRGLRDRILAYLHVMSGNIGSQTFRINMSREQIARYLCVNRSALSYELNEMKREGIIDFTGRIFTLK
ncbi:MAG: Crp/Fnr family transcriptional regulator [Clostridiales bacterium]|nr:Crp/Fnr family transcriptional regulator [Clostridiales bacterium]